ncbi:MULTISPECIES: Txe/YoeB family addiction module toxin [unclassified Mucilaginibacter]|uniref:Txe/YoeB family addiction module toxin n=1 Tax=unclassified Mucilaginibacter TaxID=2617802 RepID=UPI000AB90986|nr:MULTISPECIES: Txe/YoeB family addiction module toxin [unclassified Mucilaginibacter]
MEKKWEYRRAKENQRTDCIYKETPFEGIGKPEALKHQLVGKWSRRINHEHRLIYSFDNDIISIYSLKGHY